jgi:predicted AAA+ superfamily ATPase
VDDIMVDENGDTLDFLEPCEPCEPCEPYDLNMPNDPYPPRELIDRTINHALVMAMQNHPVILLTGPRLVGKSELLRQIGHDYDWVSFEDIHCCLEAQWEPELFFMNRGRKLVLDHIEFVPDLFPHLKKRIDLMRAEALQKNQPEECLYILSGTQLELLVQTIHEVFGDLVAILPMQGLSYREQRQIRCPRPFVPDQHYLKLREIEPTNIGDLWTMIHRGHLPEMITQNSEWEESYSNCVQLIDGRDVKKVTINPGDDSFIRFMSAVAARSGELVNYDNIARTVGISPPTAKRWLHVLVAHGHVMLLHPYPSDDFKRMVKTPKMYFMDTGLMAWLTRWLTPETIQKGAMAGQFFETWVVSEIAKSYLNAGKSLRNLYFYRDADQREIDLIIDLGDSIHPVEIRLTARPDKRMAHAFHLLEPLLALGDIEIGDGAVISLHPAVLDLAPRVRAIPAGYL